MSVEIRLSGRAERDIQGGTNYTLQNWGERQARRYINGLGELFQKIAKTPGIGQPRPEIGPLFRSVNYASHCVYYEPQDGFISIFAVLHQAQDSQHQLGKTE